MQTRSFHAILQYFNNFRQCKYRGVFLLTDTLLRADNILQKMLKKGLHSSPTLVIISFVA